MHLKLLWYLNRLQSMEPAEVLHRLIEHSRKVVSRYVGNGWHHYPSPSLYPVFPRWREAVGVATASQRNAIEVAARDTLEGRFRALGMEWPRRDQASLFPREIWRFDPVTGTLWPGQDTYAHDINFRSTDRGDVKYVWEMGRLQQLPPLAAYSIISDDGRSIEAIEKAIASWHSANPPFRGVGWASGIEVALRAISLIVTLDLAGEQLGTITRRQIGEILCASAYWLERFPSRYSSANNHLVAELGGQYLISLAFGAESHTVRQMLADETMKQILADGTGVEQTPTYAAFTAEIVLLSAAAACQAGIRFPDNTEQRLLAFSQFVDWLPKSGNLFGDDDEGRVITLGAEHAYPTSVAAAIRGFLHQPGVQVEAGDFRAVFFRAPAMSAHEPVGLKTFAEGGLSIWRGELNGRHVEVMFDHGPLGYLSIAAHGHADALAFSMWIDGMPVLVDPGTWLYGAGGIWRDWFRSTPAHNTLNIEGASQSIISGKFNWSRKATTTLLRSEPEPEWSLCGQQDGFESRFGVLHRRTLHRVADSVFVTDQLLGKSHMAEIVFQLAARMTAKRDRNRITVMHDDERLLEIELPDMSLHLCSGGENPGEGGWVAPRFGAREPAWRAAWQGRVGDKGVRFKLTPVPRKSDAS